MASAKQATIDYLQKHDIKVVVEQAINRLVKAKPDEPWQFLSREFAALSSIDDTIDTTSTQIQPPQGTDAKKPEIIFVLGGPGSGKGTACARLVEDYGFVHLSAGDLLRAERKTGSKNAELINTYIKEGKIVPVEITVALIQKEIQAQFARGNNEFLIDGFPRNANNDDGWRNIMGDSVHVRFVLNLDCTEETMLERLLERGKTSGRSDDNIESIKKRFATFHNETQPVIAKYEAEGKVRTVSAAPAAHEVYAEIKKIIGPPKPQIVFVLGGPGSGKGTACAKIVRDYGYVHLSAGDLLRAERKTGSKNAELINTYIKEGKIVPVEITVALLKKAIDDAAATGKQNFLVDGFPRNANNDEGWSSIMEDSVNVKFILNLECSQETMQERLLGRAKTSGRSDDNIESIKKRFVTFVEETKPVIAKYTKLGKVRTVDASGTADAVYSSIQGILGTPKPKIVFVLGGPGSGKGTACAKIVRDYGYVHLSAGDLLRAERKTGSKNAELINTYIKEGKIVPVEITVALLKKAIDDAAATGKQNFLVDGFPRNANNDEGWRSIIGDSVIVQYVLNLDCSEETMLERLMERSKTSGRSDDNLESIKKRFATFQNETKPVVAKYEAEGKVRNVSAAGTASEVYNDIKQILGPMPPQVVFVLGGPGSGKGTQCSKIIQRFSGWVHLSAGDLLRAERKTGSRNAELINTYIKEGKIVPVEITIGLIKKAIEDAVKDGPNHFLVDGFPRNAENKKGWDRIMGSFCNVRFVLFMDCPESTMEERLIDRGQTSGRSDDNIEVIKKRFATFQQQSMPVVDAYKALGKVRVVSSVPPADDVFQEVGQLFQQEFAV